MDKNSQEVQYAVIIIAKLQELFDKDHESDLKINLEDFDDDDKFTAFFHALFNMAPSRIYNQLTGDNKTTLEVNHIANQLCFQYGKRKKNN